MSTHRRLTVLVADHEANDPSWRVKHADESVSAVTLAYFERDRNGDPVQQDDGTFIVHAPSRDTLDALRAILTSHEGMTIVGEDEAPGNGIIVTR